MAASSRVSGFWSVHSDDMGYYGRRDEEVGLVSGAEDEEEDVYDGRTPLDRTIDKIGMGSYQWTLLSLCGFGWLADNMWIQAIAIILPRVQQHFSVPDRYVGTLSSSMFAGMMFGAVGWGTCSDLMGRTAAFNATLFLTAVFGVLASFANTFTSLCIALFLLGSAVGGSMPTDGTLLLEHMPNGKQYLVTALSVFFSVGSVVSAVIALIVIPSRSCPPAPEACDVATQNMGWKYLLISLGLITLAMFIARMVFFRLHESPRYLVHAGRHQEAIESLQMISKFNGGELELDLEDVQDHRDPSHNSAANGEASAAAGRSASPPKIVVFDADASAEPAARTLHMQTSREVLRGSSESRPLDYSSTGEAGVNLSDHTFQTPQIISGNASDSTAVATPAEEEEEDYIKAARRPRHTRSRRSLNRSSTASIMETKSSKLYWALPRVIRNPMAAWVDRVAMVLTPEWLRTTLLVWATWCSMSLAYTMFNVYLPKLLEGRGGDDGALKSLSGNLWDVVIYTVGGCPGAIIGAWLVDSRLGRRWSLAGSTLLTSLFCLFFVYAQRPWAVQASTVGISLSATAMWAVLYGWTPEIFDTKVRGTACGIASALSRIGGMIAPLLGGALLMVDASFPVYASIMIFLVAVVSVLMLRGHEGNRGGAGGLTH
ncbi:major facilitator superfamily domain-containing protein [Cytidiella melzeri]|nr:major facilitator superfamily domain-containing protein [Cytidiella melzeri]